MPPPLNLMWGSICFERKKKKKNSIPLLHSGVADTLQRTGLKIGQLCAAPYYPGHWGSSP